MTASANTWPPSTFVRMLKLAVHVMDRGGFDLGVELVRDATSHNARTLSAIAASVRYHVHTEDPHLGSGPSSFRVFLHAIERGEFDGERNAPPFDAGTAALAFASCLRLGDTPDTSPIAARFAEWVTLAMSELAEAAADAVPALGDVFVALPAHEVERHVKRVGLGEQVAIRPGRAFGSVMRGTGPDGSGFVSRCRADGWGEAMKGAELSVVVPVPAHIAARRLQDAGLLRVHVDVQGAPGPERIDGHVPAHLFARSYLGRGFVGVATVKDFEAAIRYACSVLDELRAAEARRSELADERQAETRPEGAPDPEAGGGIAHAVLVSGGTLKEGADEQIARAFAEHEADERVRAAIRSGVAPRAADVAVCSKTALDELRASGLPLQEDGS